MMDTQTPVKRSDLWAEPQHHHQLHHLQNQQAGWCHRLTGDRAHHANFFGPIHSVPTGEAPQHPVGFCGQHAQHSQHLQNPHQSHQAHQSRQFLHQQHSHSHSHNHTDRQLEQHENQRRFIGPSGGGGGGGCNNRYAAHNQQHSQEQQSSQLENQPHQVDYIQAHHQQHSHNQQHSHHQQRYTCYATNDNHNLVQQTHHHHHHHHQHRPHGQHHQHQYTSRNVADQYYSESAFYASAVDSTSDVNLAGGSSTAAQHRYYYNASQPTPLHQQQPHQCNQVGPASLQQDYSSAVFHQAPVDQYAYNHANLPVVQDHHQSTPHYDGLSAVAEQTGSSTRHDHSRDATSHNQAAAQDHSGLILDSINMRAVQPHQQHLHHQQHHLGEGALEGLATNYAPAHQPDCAQSFSNPQHCTASSNQTQHPFELYQGSLKQPQQHLQQKHQQQQQPWLPPVATACNLNYSATFINNSSNYFLLVGGGGPGGAGAAGGAGGAGTTSGTKSTSERRVTLVKSSGANPVSRTVDKRAVQGVHNGRSRSSYDESRPTLSTSDSLGVQSKVNQCHICNRHYARPSTLKTHLRTHTNERPYKCPVCLKTFSQAANLTAHQRVHTGERPFPCPICGRQFSQSSSVITHLRTHSGERPYRCTMCDRTFSDSSTLTKHCRIHSGEKPYQCEFCPLNFSQSGNLSRHIRLHLAGHSGNSGGGNGSGPGAISKTSHCLGHSRLSNAQSSSSLPASGTLLTPSSSGRGSASTSASGHHSSTSSSSSGDRVE